MDVAVRVNSEARNRWFIPDLLSPVSLLSLSFYQLTIRPYPTRLRLPFRLPAKRPIKHLLGERHALVFQQLSVLLHMTVQRNGHLPRARKDLRIFDSGFIHEDIRAARRVALHHMQGVAM